MKFQSKFRGMPADHLGEIISPLKSVVHLLEFVRISPDGECIEDNILDPFTGGIQRPNAAVCAGRKSLGGQTDGYPAPVPSVVVSPRLSNGARPRYNELKPGTRAPLCATG